MIIDIEAALIAAQCLPESDRARLTRQILLLLERRGLATTEPTRVIEF